MHRILSLFVVFVAAATASAQIPNASFENWTDGFPDGWLTTNIPGLVIPITQTQDASAGNFAARGEVVDGFGTTWPPYMQTWFSVEERPAALTGSYKFSSVENDSLFIDIIFYTQSLGFGYGAGFLTAPPTGDSFEEFSVPIEYFSEGKGTATDSALIQIAVFGEDTVHAGSRFIIDDLAFSGTATAVEAEGVPSGFALQQNYPNPFNPTTTIQYTLPVAGHVTVTISNLLGETVATIVDSGQPAGQNAVRFDAAGLPSGLYFYTLRSGALVETRRMTLMK